MKLGLFFLGGITLLFLAIILYLATNNFDALLLSDWSRGFLQENYVLNSRVDIVSSKKIIYKWGDEASGGYLSIKNNPTGKEQIIIYKLIT